MLGLLEPVVGIRRGCELAGISRATLYRKRNPRPAGKDPEGPRPAPPNKLSPAECDELAAVLNSGRFADKAPRQVWASLIDEGTYLASVSTMYRLLRDRGEVRERRAQAQWPCFKVWRGIVTVSWRMMVLKGSLRTAGCRTGSRSGC